MKPKCKAATLLFATCLLFVSTHSFSQCTPPPVAPVYTPIRVNINQYEAVTYDISNAVAGYFYEVMDLASGQPLGQGVWATINGTLVISTDPFTLIGRYTIYIRASYLLGVTQCTAVSEYGSVNVNLPLLPLELIQFSGKDMGTSILLLWETANEDRINRFEIERSETGSLFKLIGQVAAAGQNNAGKNYKFTDTHPSGSANYYRLKMVDLDGKFSYSNMILFKGQGSLTANVLPNPFSESLTLQVSLKKTQLLHMRLIDASGAVIYTTEVKGRQGKNIISFHDLSAIPNGNYILQLRNSEGMFQQKVVKINR